MMVAPYLRSPAFLASSTSRMAALPSTCALSSAPRMISAFTVEPPHQAFEFFQFLAAQPSALGELGDEGRDLSAEQAIDEIAALLVHVVFAAHQRPVKIATPIGCGGQRLLLDQPCEEGAD